MNEDEELGIRNEGGGFAENIYGRCPEVAFKSPVTSYQSLFSHLNLASKMCYTVRNGRYHAACRDAGASPCIRMRKAGH